MTPHSDRFTYPAEKARQGRIVLKKPWMRAAFIAGLVGIAAVAFVVVANLA